MKKSIKEKFKNNFRFVRPLYKNAKTQDLFDQRTIPIHFDRTLKLCGNDIDVKTIISKSTNVANIKRKINKEYKVVLPGACENSNTENKNRDLKALDYSKLRFNRVIVDKSLDSFNKFKTGKKMLSESKKGFDENKRDDTNQGSKYQTVVFHKVPNSWLRVYPAQKIPGETLCSVIVRCFLCQLGLASFLILWTITAIFVIHSFEGPHEIKVSLDFEKDQNQLVIDLATELRQITPISPKWRYAIERRIEDERKLTMQAVALGARIKPGRFWNLSGTLLFTIYVMTALGFGAPVPHTVWGRTTALLYALFAVPVHIYFMMNVSICTVVKIDEYTKNIRSSTNNTAMYQGHNESPDHSRNAGLGKTTRKPCYRRFFDIVCAGRCLPFAVSFYYILGLVCFGVLRNKNSFETIMFPLEFTTSGGLELVEGYIRILYSLYIEGAVFLFACTLATIRRYSGPTFENISENYRIFTSETCQNCSNTR